MQVFQSTFVTHSDIRHSSKKKDIYFPFLPLEKIILSFEDGMSCRIDNPNKTRGGARHESSWIHVQRQF